MSSVIEGWRVVAEVHSFDGHHVDRDHLESATFVNAVIEPAVGTWPYHYERVSRATSNRASLSESGADPLAHSPVGVKPVDAPPTQLLEMLAGSGIADAERLVVEASRRVALSEELRGWYRLPKPRSTPTKRGLGGRNVREFAELANLFVSAVDWSPEAPVKRLAEEFAYTGYPSTWWHQIGNSLAKNGFIDERRWGVGGGSLTKRTIDELNAHKKGQ